MDMNVARRPSKEDERWRAVVSRDANSDGRFFYCVKTTGVYCRPSCPSRTPRRENVVFVDTHEAAEALGFRRCKRCGRGQGSKAERNTEIVAKVCRTLATAENRVNIGAILKELGISRSHFQRLFKSMTGITPKSYESSIRARRFVRNLQQAKTVTDAIYVAGFGSNGRFYSNSDKILGMTPTQYKNAGAETRITFAVGQCSLGSILVASTVRGVCAIALGDDPELLVQELQDTFPKAELNGGDAAYEELVSLVVGQVENPVKDLQLPLDISGTVFQTRVWEALRKIPPGSKVSYAEIARQIGRPRAIRAVAQACASNKIAIVIPCHRVVRTDGSLSGYRWGIARKKALLEREEKTESAEGVGT